MLTELKEKRKDVAVRIQKLQALLDSIEWTDSTRSQRMLTPGRLDKINAQLAELHDDKTVQQFLYDTEEIQSLTERLQSLAMISWIGAADFDQKSKLVIQKLLCHQAYSKRHLWPLAVANLIELERFIANTSTTAENKVVNQWYRMFVVDHAISRMHPETLDRRIDHDPKDFQKWINASRDGLIQSFESLIPASLSASPDTDRTLKLDQMADADRYLLRTAHYYGHRGNEKLSRLQDLKWKRENTPNGNNFAHVPGLVDEASLNYNKAIILRLYAFAKSFIGLRADLIEDDQRVVSSVTGWSKDWMQQNEAFLLTSQALADIANQYAALSCVYCYEHAYSKYSKRGDLSTISHRAVNALNNANYYWRKANINGLYEGVGEPYRIVARKRLAEHMVFIITGGKDGTAINYYEKNLENWEHGIFQRFYDMRQLSGAGGGRR
jgi:hypothetical protein